jgi:hypothetical protein
MSKQVWAREFACVLSSSAVTFSIAGSPAVATIADPTNATPIPASGTIGQLTIWIDTLPAAATSKIFTVVVNGTPSAMVVTLDNTHQQATYAGAAISVSAGDRVWISYTVTGSPGSSSIANISWVFTGSNGVSIYCGGPAGLSTTTPAWLQPFMPSAGTSTTVATDAQIMIPTGGTITGYYATLASAAGAVGSYRLTLYKNGVIQDGTSGSPDTRLTLTNVNNSRVNGNTSFTLSVVAGDLIYMQVDSVSSPSSKSLAFGVAFTATNAGESILAWTFPTTPNSNGGSVNFNGPHNLISTGWNSEANRQSVVADKFKITAMRVWMTTGPGAGKSRTFENRKNLASGAASLSITDTNTNNSVVASTSYSALDTICFYESAVAGSTPTQGTGSVAMVMFIQGGNPPAKSQQGNKKNAGGAVNSIQPGGTICMTLGNAGNSSQVN